MIADHKGESVALLWSQCCRVHRQWKRNGLVNDLGATCRVFLREHTQIDMEHGVCLQVSCE
jgi:hypothetical protein